MRMLGIILFFILCAAAVYAVLWFGDRLRYKDQDDWSKQVRKEGDKLKAAQELKERVHHNMVILAYPGAITLLREDSSFPSDILWAIVVDGPVTQTQVEEIRRRFAYLTYADPEKARAVVDAVRNGTDEADTGPTEPTPGGLLPQDRQWLSDQLKPLRWSRTQPDRRLEE